MSETTTPRQRVIEATTQALRQPIELTRAVQQEWLRALEIEPVSARELAGEYVKLTRATLGYQFELVNASRKLTVDLVKGLVAPLRRAKRA